MNDKRRTISGFSLLEILVAMAILSVIILLMTTIFNQSSQAWDRGLSKSEKGMAGRAALNLMTSELKNAVATDGNLTGPTLFNASSMSFNSLTKADADDERIVKYITYSLAGNKINRSTSPYKDDYSGLGSASSAELIDDVTGFKISALGGSATSMPESVTLSINLEKSSKTAWAEAYSYGPNGVDNNGQGDDISTEERN